MDDTTTTLTAEPESAETPVVTDQVDGEIVEEELLVEEVSIDGMCGVY